MSNIQTGAERMPHDLSHLGFLAGQIGRLITISTTPVIAGGSFEMDAVGALRLSTLRRGLAIDSTVDIFTFYVPHRHVYGEQWIKFMKDGVNATPLPTVNTTGYIDHAAFLGTINPDTNKIPKHLFQGYLNIYNNYFKVFFSSGRRHTRFQGDWSSDVCSSDLAHGVRGPPGPAGAQPQRADQHGPRPARRADLCHAGRGHGAAPGHGAAAGARPHPPGPCALSRRGPGDQRGHGRPGRSGHSDDHRRHAAGAAEKAGRRGRDLGRSEERRVGKECRSRW